MKVITLRSGKEFKESQRTKKQVAPSKVLRCFTIPYTTRNSYFEKALRDLGANINLKSYYVFKKLGLQEPHPTNISLQLPDKTITHPLNIAKDIFGNYPDTRSLALES
ncbi:hypothetical protein CR513_51620, partial [Mucuna pruriens]